MVGGAVVTYGQPVSGMSYLHLAVLFSLVFGGLTFVSTVAWAALGASIGRLLGSRRSVRIFNAVMAAMLVASLVPIVLE